ncbi:MAG TPA: hypothetical protein VLD63_00945 [Anaerolineales bacterium]|nr:hypothetical protein [Anaerolineales bacterium]
MDEAPWEYRVETLGSMLRSPKDDQLAELLNAWGEEGWEFASALLRRPSQAVTLIARRRLTRQERRRRTRPGEAW